MQRLNPILNSSYTLLRFRSDVEFCALVKKSGNDKQESVNKLYLITGEQMTPNEQCQAGAWEVVLVNCTDYFGFEIMHVECEGREYLAVNPAVSL